MSCWWPSDCMAPPLIAGRVAGMLITLTDLLSRSVPPGGVSSASICGWRTFPVGEGRTAGLLALAVTTTRAPSIVIRSSVLISVSGDANRRDTAIDFRHQHLLKVGDGGMLKQQNDLAVGP